MASDLGDPTEAPPARDTRGESKKGFRVVFAAYLAVTIVFIALTATVVVQQIFVDGDVPSRGDRIPPLAHACESGLRALGDSLDRGIREALWSNDEESATRRFEAGIAGAWQHQAEVEHACSTEPAAKVALAAMLRQRRIQEGWARRHARETIAAAGVARRFLPVESAPPRDVSR